MRTLTQRLTEDQLIASIIQALGEQPRTLLIGAGDDAAVWKPRRSHFSLITTDALVDGVHFKLAETTPKALGHKALAVNLSDIAAMGGLPMLAVVALGVTDAVDESWAREFYGGISKLARSCDCAIAGGDIVRAPALLVSVTVVGDVRRSNLRLRSGARPGDHACVTGPLGLSAAHLALERGTLRSIRPSPDHAEVLRLAYEMPAPRVAEGELLGSSRATHAMMDLSDGLSLDLARMARASAVDACIELDALQPHPALTELTAESSAGNAMACRSTLRDLMLHGGDDYELLVAVDSRAYPHIARRFRTRFKRELAIVGRFEKGSGEVWALEKGSRTKHSPRGYDHLGYP